MAYLDEEQHRRARLRNIAQSFALVGGIGIITALSAYTLFGQTGVVWALFFIGVLSLIGAREAPDRLCVMFNARPIDASSGGEIVRLVQTLSQRAGLKAAPRLYVVPSQTMNAFAVGTPSRYSLGVTEGLLRRLGQRELAGVLAHELTHVRNNDIWVMSLADILSRFTRSIILCGIPVLPEHARNGITGTPAPWLAIALLYFAPTLSSLLQLALSRSREFDADLGGASLQAIPKVSPWRSASWNAIRGGFGRHVHARPAHSAAFGSANPSANIRSHRAAHGAEKTETNAPPVPKPLGACGGNRSFPRPSHGIIGPGSGSEPAQYIPREVCPTQTRSSGVSQAKSFW